MSEDTQTNLVSEESAPPMSFRERKAQQLAAEREEREAVERQPLEPEDVNSHDHDPDEGEPEESQLLDDQPDGEPDEGVEEEEAEEYTPRERELLEAAEEAEKRRKSMEVDYRQKTQKLSESRKEVDRNLSEVEQAAQYYAQMAQQSLRQFDGINWAELRTKPEEYQQAQQHYLQAENQARHMQQELETVKQHAQKIREQERAREAEISKGMLQQLRPDWSGELYQKAQEWADAELGYSDAEFAEITDWRLMMAMVRAMEADKIKAESKQRVRKAGRKRGSAPAGRNAPQNVGRDAAGRFTTAREEAFANPGNKKTFREMKMRQLELERGRQRR